MKFIITDVDVVDLSKSKHPISTGVGFLDHMIDQLNSHAQVGVGIAATRRRSLPDADVSDDGPSSSEPPDPANGKNGKNRNALPAEDQRELMEGVGTALGTEIRALLVDAKVEPSSGGSRRSSRFCCPLDEALVECTLSTCPSPSSSFSSSRGELSQFTLPPYGIYPPAVGRTKIGCMITSYLRHLFDSIATSSGLHVSLRKSRGENGHHVVESAFKAFSRALRNLLDGVDTGGGGGGEDGEGGADDSGGCDGCGGGVSFEELWGESSSSYRQSLELNRCAEIERKTKETSISVSLKLDGMASGVTIDTGVLTLDTIFTHIATEAKLSLDIKCRGDLWVDDHHTSEDVAIAVGQCLSRALGTKAGLNRMWCAAGRYGDAEVEVTMDLSNRPCLTHDLFSSSNAYNEEYIGDDLSVEMFVHVLDSLVINGQMTVHIVDRRGGKDNAAGESTTTTAAAAKAKATDTARATAIAFGRALRMCCAVDPRRAGMTASSKGTLSV